MPGRTWATEFLARFAFQLFKHGKVVDLAKFRKELNGLKQYHPVLHRIKSGKTTIEGIECLTGSSKVVEFDESGNPIKTVIVYFHGGGYVVGQPETYKILLARLAEKLNASYVIPRYRLSPESPFPGPQNDCLKVAQKVIDTNPNSRIVLMGDSAGGALAINAAVTLAEKGYSVDKLVLISPWVDPLADQGSMISNKANDIFTIEFLSQCYQAHMQGANKQHPMTVASLANLTKLPSTLVQAGGGELFIDQINSFYQLAKERGANIELDVYPTQFHVFQVLGTFLHDSVKATNVMADFIRKG